MCFYPVSKKLTFLEIKHSMMWLSDYISASCVQFPCMPNVDWLTVANLTKLLGSIQCWTTLLLFTRLWRGTVRLPLHLIGIHTTPPTEPSPWFTIWSWFCENFLNEAARFVMVTKSWDVGVANERNQAERPARAGERPCGRHSVPVWSGCQKEDQEVLRNSVQGFHWEETQEIGSAAGRAFGELKGEASSPHCKESTKVGRRTWRAIRTGYWETVNSPALNSLRLKPVVFLNNTISFNTFCWAQCRELLKIQLPVMKKNKKEVEWTNNTVFP